MIQIVKNELQTGVKRYVCDTKDELSKIDLRTTRMGSTCYVIKTKETYILSGEWKWVLMRNASGSGSGGGSSDEGGSDGGQDGGETDPSADTDVIHIWDGGEVEGW